MVLWRLTPDRVAEWRDIRLEALADSPDAFGSTLAEWTGRPVAEFSQRLAAVETWAAGDLIGQPLAVAGWQPGWTPGTEDMGWITGVYTRPQARCRGLLQALLARIANRAARHGMIRLGLHVAIAGTPARAADRRAGFNDIGTPFVNERGIPEIEMQRPLP